MEEKNINAKIKEEFCRKQFNGLLRSLLGDKFLKHDDDTFLGYYQLCPAQLTRVLEAEKEIYNVQIDIYDDELYGKSMDNFISSLKRFAFVPYGREEFIREMFEMTLSFRAEFKLDFDLLKCVTLDTGEHGCWHFYGVTLQDALENMWWYAPRYIEEMYDIDDIDGYRFHIKGDDNEYCVCSALFHASLDYGSGDSEEKIKDFLECVLMYVEEQKHSAS